MNLARLFRNGEKNVTACIFDDRRVRWNQFGDFERFDDVHLNIDESRRIADVHFLANCKLSEDQRQRRPSPAMFETVRLGEGETAESAEFQRLATIGFDQGEIDSVHGRSRHGAQSAKDFRQGPPFAPCGARSRHRKFLGEGIQQ